MLIGDVKDVRRDIKYQKFKGTSDFVDIINSLGDEVIVHFDPDVDGIIAGYFICMYLSMIGKRFLWHVNSNREHGWGLPIDKVGGKDIIAVDFIMTYQEIVDLCDNGCNIISIDHHKNRKEFIKYSNGICNGVVVNNQYPFESEDGRYLSGAGVVFEVIRSVYPKFDTRENRALVGLTLLSDVRDIENDNARGYLYDLYNHPYKGYIKYLIEYTIGKTDYTFGVPRLDRNYVDYKLSPTINACLRFGKEEEVVDFILGSRVIDLDYRYLQKDLVSRICECVKVYEFEYLRVVAFDYTVAIEYMDVLSSFVGLVASRFIFYNDSRKSVICYLVGEGSRVVRASFRGKVNGLNYLGGLSKLINGVGHEPAFGIKGLKPSKNLFSKISNKCYIIESNSTYKPNIVTISNMSMYASRTAKIHGIENMYRLSQNKYMVKYTGKRITKKRGSKKFTQYEVDGVYVMTFDTSLTFDKGYIIPTMERGKLNFYLENGAE